MLRKRKDNSEYEIDRELTGKFAIEMNVEYQEKIEQLEEENKKLKEKVETLELWLDNKEKLNEEYRDKIDLLKYQSYGPSELADSLYDANKTIEKLKEELDKLRTDNIYEEGLYD